MAKIFKPSSSSKGNRAKASQRQLADFITEITGYDAKATAVARHESGKIVFIDDAIQDETVKARAYFYDKNIIKARSIEITEPSTHRTSPTCQHASECGGCQLQHMDATHQMDAKQQGVDSMLRKQLGLTELPWQTAISGDSWHYRRAARLATMLTNGKINLGFRKAKNKDIISIKQCPVLAKPLETAAIKLEKALNQLSGKKALGHVQLLYTQQQSHIIIRVTKTLTQGDKTILADWAQQQNTSLTLELNDNRFELLAGQNKDDYQYQLDDITLSFTNKDFIQVNDLVNQHMVKQAINWLVPEQGDIVMDLFSGIGNFTLPLAKHCQKVIAVEGVTEMVQRVKHNAQKNGITNIEAYQANLADIDKKSKISWLKKIDKLLLDPARDGALAVVKNIPLFAPKEILYVSCNPATMARDMKELLSSGYKLQKISLLNMFPQTSHVEVMALLSKKA